MVRLRRFVFVVVTAGAAAVGLPDAVAAQTPGPDDVVLWTAGASSRDVHGDWVREADATAAGGVVLRNPDRGRAKVTTALASPANYFEMRFTAKRVHRVPPVGPHAGAEQFHQKRLDPRAVQRFGRLRRVSPLVRIGSTSSAEVVLQNGPSGRRAARLGLDRQRLGHARCSDLLCRRRRSRRADSAAGGRCGHRSDRAQSRRRSHIGARCPLVGHEDPAARVGRRAERVGRERR